jgi:nitrate/TMAO reductase-like tetraheme cytochrome c subunit
MDPWIRDMKDPKSQTLAARHYQERWINEDQCYTCHTGYGLAGNVKAKMGGLSHVLHQYVTGVPADIRIREPFPVSTCLHCHAEQAGYLKIEQHGDAEMKPKILSGEMSCFECHASPHPRSKP